jgi:hypothetical protein
MTSTVARSEVRLFHVFLFGLMVFCSVVFSCTRKTPSLFHRHNLTKAVHLIWLGKRQMSLPLLRSMAVFF